MRGIITENRIQRYGNKKQKKCKKKRCSVKKREERGKRSGGKGERVLNEKAK